jgi:hypothetical protein
MTKLTEILKRARPQIDWFALGEAVRLAQEIEKLDGTESEERVVDLAQRAAAFLSYKNIENASRFATELKLELAQMERPINGPRKQTV